MRKRWWLILAVLVVLGAGVVGLAFEPTGTVRAWLAGEPFYREHPLRYWRDLLAESGRSGRLSAQTANRFSHREAVPILLACVHDPNPNVRWPAVLLLGDPNVRTKQTLAVLTDALGDPNPEVRFYAIMALVRCGPAAHAALPALAARLTDADAQVADRADKALWQIDPSYAVSACGWQSFTSQDYGFAVKLPDQPEREDSPIPNLKETAHAFFAQHRLGHEESPTRYAIMVVDYAAETLHGMAEDDWVRGLTNSAPLFFPGGTIIEEKKVSQAGLHGREYIVEVPGKGFIKSRGFWVGRRLYGLIVVYQPEFLNQPAAEYFLNSFRLQKPSQARPKPR